MAKNSPGVKSVKLALMVAALLLLVLAATSYTEYLEKRFERDVLAKQAQAADEEATLQARIDDRFAKLEERLTAQPPVDPLARDQEVLALRRELQAMKAEREVMDTKIDQIQKQERIDSLGGNPLPNPEASLTPEQRSIKRAAAVASVTGFNQEWGFVMLDGGSARGLSPGERLALRRGDAVVALLEISDVEENNSVANLVKGGPGGRGNAIPQQGDKVIAWPLLVK